MKNLLITFFCSMLTFGFTQPGARDLTFGNFNEHCSFTYDLGVQSNGKIVICGNLVLGNFNIVNIIRLNHDGTKDNTFHDFDLGDDMLMLTAYKIKIADDNSIFALVATRSNLTIKKLDENGNIDDNFNVSTPNIQSFEVIGGNKLLISTNAGIIKLNSDGTVDNMFNSINLTTVYPLIKIKKIDVNEIYVYGFFTHDSQTKAVLKIDENGAVDNTFNFQNLYFSGGVKDIIKQNDGKLLVTGVSSPVQITRHNVDGSIDNSFNTFDFTAFGQAVGSDGLLEIQNDNKIVYSSWSTLRRFNVDGSLDSSFLNHTALNGYVLSLTYLENEEKIYLTGNFCEYDGTDVTSVVRIYTSDSNLSNKENNLETNFKLYPNPTKQEITLSFTTYQKQIANKLLNLAGQMILEKSNLYGKEVKVNLSEVPNGMYLMEVRTENGYEHIKLIKD